MAATLTRAHMRRALAQAVHVLLYTREFHNFEVNAQLVCALLHGLGVAWRTHAAAPGSRYWNKSLSVQDHFFHTACPGSVLTLSALEALMADHLELEAYMAGVTGDERRWN